MASDWANVTPFSLCLVAPQDRPAIALADVLDYLRARRLLGSAPEASEVDAIGMARVLLAVDEDFRLMLADPDGSVHPGDHFKDVLPGMARALGCFVQVSDVVVLDPEGEPCPPPEDLIPRGDEVRVAYAWRSTQAGIAEGISAALHQEFTRWTGDGWTVIAPGHGVSPAFDSSPVGRRYHPFAMLTRTGSARIVFYVVDRRSKRLPVAVVWQPTPAPVLTDVPTGSDAWTIGAVLCAPTMSADDFANRGLTDAAIADLVAATRLPDGEEFFGAVARVLHFPAAAGLLVDAPASDPTPASIGETATVLPTTLREDVRSGMGEIKREYAAAKDEHAAAKGQREQPRWRRWFRR